MAVRLITDAGSDLIAEQAKKLDVILVPMTVRFGAKEYHSGVDITNEEFYNKLSSTNALPTTSQPSPYEFERIFQQIAADGDEAVVLCISSALSGTYQSATIAADSYENRIFIVDTQAVSIAQKILLDFAISLRNQGACAKDIATKLEEKKKEVCAFGAVDTLEYLIKGGRLSTAAGVVGSILGIRPILRLTDGRLEVVGKARGARASVAMTHALIEKTGVDLSMPCGVGYTGNDPQAITLYLETANSQWNKHNIPVYQIGSTVGTHTGPGLFLAAFFRKSQ